MKSPLFFAALFAALNASAQPAPGAGEQPRHGPPPEAFDACKGKADGAPATLTTPEGQTVNGTCRMVLIPTEPRQHGKPPAR